ncbi:MAG: N-acetylglucosamine-6-phosphate deacetylase [Hyphomicrobiales bacterium]
MPNKLLIKDGVLALPSGPARADLLCDGHRIVAMGRALEVEDGADVFDATGLTVGPGFIDIHVHGGGGHSFFTRDPRAVTGYAAWAPRNGVTSFLVSTVGPNAEMTAAMLSSLTPTVGVIDGAAEVLGFHLEGPFINPERRGAFHPDMLRPPGREEFLAYQEAARGHIRQVTFAPELPGALALAAAIVSTGAVASVGHTDATTAEARAGFDAGACHVTHLFNAMRPLHQREGGPIVAALLNDDATCEVVCDGTHVMPDVVRLAYRALGPQRMVVVTDNLHIAGTDSGTGQFGGQDVEVSGPAAVRADGTIVGSVATMDQHFRNAVAFLGLDLPTAFRLCATNPARVAGASRRKGMLERGYDADLVLLDAGLNVAATVCRGQLVYRAPLS